MAKNISFDTYRNITNNEEYDPSFRSLLKIFFITGLRINEVSKLINAVVKEPEINTISFKGKMGINIDQDIIPEIRSEILNIKNKWKNEASIAKSIWRWNKKYGLEIEAHAIRRLAATLIDKNLDTRHAQALLNHMSVATTERYILEVSKFDKKMVAQQVLIEISKHGEEIKTLNHLREENLHLKMENEALKVQMKRKNFDEVFDKAADKAFNKLHEGKL